MEKLQLKYTDKDGRVFLLETSGVEFKAGCSEYNNGEMLSIVDMTKEQSFDCTETERHLLKRFISMAVETKVFDLQNAKQIIDDKDNNLTDEDFI